jgi:hypothetical protein
MQISLAQGVEGWNKFFFKAWNIISLVENKGVNIVQCVGLWKQKKLSFFWNKIWHLLVIKY